MKKKKKKSLPLRNKIRQHPRLRNLVQIRQVIVVCPVSEEGIVKDMMFSVIIVTGLDTLQSIVGRNSKRMQKLQENQQGIPLNQGLIDRRRRERACNYVYIHQNSNARAGYTINSL